jgi:hypothetical protein
MRSLFSTIAAFASPASGKSIPCANRISSGGRSPVIEKLETRDLFSVTIPIGASDPPPHVCVTVVVIHVSPPPPPPLHPNW